MKKEKIVGISEWSAYQSLYRNFNTYGRVNIKQFISFNKFAAELKSAQKIIFEINLFENICFYTTKNYSLL